MRRQKKKKQQKRILRMLISILSLLAAIVLMITFFNKGDYVRNPDHIQVLVNRENKLSPQYVPKDLVTPQIRFTFEEDLPKRKMRREAAEALERMFTAAEKEGIILFATSGYRSYERQNQLYQERTSALGIQAAAAYIALPGSSEHQTGLAMDIGNQLTEDFGNSEEGKWLKRNCYKFGYIIRYPYGKEDITGINYEPWHIRYVGIEAAETITAQGTTLEEFLGAPAVGRFEENTDRKAIAQLQNHLETILKRFVVFASTYK